MSSKENYSEWFAQVKSFLEYQKDEIKADGKNNRMLFALVRENDSEDNTYALSALFGSSKPLEDALYDASQNCEGIKDAIIFVASRILGIDPDEDDDENSDEYES